MKTYKTILKDMQKNSETIKQLEAQVESLYFKQERQTAAELKNFNRVKELRSAADDNRAEIEKLNDKIQDLKIKQKILRDNVHAAMYNELIPALIEIFKPYEGKQYGAATHDKIRNAARAQGFGFWIDGYITKDTINIYLLDKDGYSMRFDSEKTTEFQRYNREAFISSDNKIQFAAALEGVKNPFRYTENVTKAVNDIKKTYKKYKKAADTARAAQDELNKILPASMRFDKISDTKYMRLI